MAPLNSGLIIAHVEPAKNQKLEPLLGALACYLVQVELSGFRAD
jgi:hypothetical protein